MKNVTPRKIIFILFFASGISGLIYEVVWLRMLSRVIGVTTYATATVLAAFMAGLAIGSFVFGRLSDKRNDQLKVYALLQLSVAFTALIMPYVIKAPIPIYRYIYEATNQNINLIGVLRIFVSFISLLVPTLLMGGTLPVLTSYLVKREGLFGRNFSLLYGLNTLGAVLGVLLSGFITIGFFGEWNTVFIGVLINIAVAGVAFQLYRKRGSYIEGERYLQSSAAHDLSISPYPDRTRKIVLVSILVSGFTALAYEVIWTRQFILFFHTSVYAFSAVLVVFLSGIAVGSIFINRLIDRIKTPLVVFGILELAIGILSVSSLYLFPLLEKRLLSRVLAPLILVFPLTFLFGAIFPVASLCYAKSVKRSGISTGIFYSFNTIGNVTGSLFTGFLFIVLLGSVKTIILLSFVNIVLGLILLWLEASKSQGYKSRYLLAIPVISFLSIGLKGQDPFLNIIERRIASGAYKYEIFYNRECAEGTVTSFIRDNSKGLLINSVGQTELCTDTKLMAHLPILLAKDPKRILVICFGMGTTIRSASIYDNLDITSVELVPEVYECFKYYHSDAQKILNRNDLNLVTGDGRNFLLLSSDKYEVITIDPSPPIYSAGTVNLYTQEFLSLCRSHLTPDGVMCLWFPGGTRDDNLFVLKTFHSVFPNTSVWRGTRNIGFFIIGTIKETNIDKPKIESALSDPKFFTDLNEYDNSCVTGSQLLNLLILQKDDIHRLTKNALIITDNFPYTEFPLWRNIFKY
jgi:spermidine synthase